MSSLRFKMVLSLVCALSSAAAIVGCGGGGSSSDDPVALCKQGCDKSFELCFKDAGSVGGMSIDSLKSTCTNGCSMNGSNSASSQTCSNSSEIISAYKTCLGKTTCNDLMSCELAAPKCKATGTGSGSGGTTSGGAGRTSGGAGSSAGGTCADLLACCNKAAANIKSGCMTAYTQAMMSGGDAVCNVVLMSGRSSLCP